MMLLVAPARAAVDLDAVGAVAGDDVAVRRGRAPMTWLVRGQTRGAPMNQTVAVARTRRRAARSFPDEVSGHTLFEEFTWMPSPGSD